MTVISTNISNLLAFPYRIQNLENGHLVHESINPLFDVPKYRHTNEVFFKALKDEGWQCCPDGYAVYVRRFQYPGNWLLVLHGLKVKGISTYRGAAVGLTVRTDRSKVEEHVNKYLSSIAVANDAIKNEISGSIHEIRSVNAALYHAAVELQGKLINQGVVEALARNTTALSELLAARITLVDAIASEGLITQIERKPIAIYKKFDKMQKCFQAYSKAKKVDIKMNGDSRLEVSGDDLSELIPLLLIDNAVKYSPQKSTVNIEVVDEADRVTCSVTSLGPRLEPGEDDLIFQRNYRGKNASQAATGNGIGLCFLKQLMAAHGGSVRVSQSAQRKMVGNVAFCDTTFSLVFPTWLKI
ncbi:HAMP domain-containing sensor histidine kinase [Alcaligenes phenolicus]|uniref:sensor histidine kinase n=1 Tax=Alcaligenes phenolicus TaxID=232846 RepID=UPI002AA72A35|nr:HAMP domain-containing sensor histidine kinase [Alcaligenes phenolicus]